MTINSIKLDETQSANNLLWWTLEDQVSKLTGIISDCERLVRTPVPLAYSVHTSRLLSVWVGSLPFVLVGCFTSYKRLLTVPLTAFVAWALFCTEELGHIIEEPFGAAGSGEHARVEVLPLDRYCDSLQTDLEDQTCRAKARALRSMNDASRAVTAAAKGVEDSGSYGPGDASSNNGPPVTEEQALEIAFDAQVCARPSNGSPRVLSTSAHGSRAGARPSP